MARLSGMQSEAAEFRDLAGSGYGVWLSFKALEAILATVAKAGWRVGDLYPLDIAVGQQLRVG